MNEKSIYTVSVHQTGKLATFRRTFLYEPTAADLIQAIKAKIGQVQQAINEGEGDEEDAEMLSTDLESLQHYVEVVVAAKTIDYDPTYTQHSVKVAGVIIGSICIERHTALDKPQRRRK